MDHYLSDETYDRLVEAITSLEPEIIGNRLAIDAEKVKWLLGERGSVWPASIQPITSVGIEAQELP